MLTFEGTLLGLNETMTRKRYAKYVTLLPFFTSPYPQTSLTTYSTLEMIAERGVRAFYEGVLGKSFHLH